MYVYQFMCVNKIVEKNNNPKKINLIKNWKLNGIFFLNLSVEKENVDLASL